MMLLLGLQVNPINYSLIEAVEVAVLMQQEDHCSQAN